MNDIVAELKSAIGADRVHDDEDSRSFYSTDVYRAGEKPLAVIRPENGDELQTAIRIAGRKGIAMFARGGGASYTDGYTPSTPNAILIDTGRLNKILEINEQDMYVTVEPGVTWASLREALLEKGLRTPFWGPFSGLVATVGGSVSQNSVSHGTARYGVSAESVLSMDIILANGDRLRTGSAGRDGADAPFFRYTGPDLTGLFTGDAGALGVKASITLRLIRTLPVAITASFGFPTFEAMHNAMAEIGRAGLADDNFAIDPTLQEGQIARQNASSLMATAREVLRTSPNIFDGAGKVMKMAAAGSEFLKKGMYAVHYTVEGHTQAEAKGKLSKLRDIALTYGQEIPNSVPNVVRAMPFAPFYNILGPRGERWVPIHGVLPYSVSHDYEARWKAVLAKHAAEMDRLGVYVGHMYLSVGASGFLYEIAFYWKDARHIYHEKMLPADHFANIETFDANDEARALVETLKREAVELYQEFGAIHFQLGKSYPFLANRRPETASALTALKHALDPDNLMNPGALGFPGAGAADHATAAE